MNEQKQDKDLLIRNLTPLHHSDKLTDEDIKNVLKELKESAIVVNYDSTERSKNVKKTVLDKITVHFTLEYDVHISDFIEATHTNPAEATFTFTNLDHYDIELRRNKKLLDISENDILEIDNILFTKLY